MALIKCPDCGKEYSSRATVCPNCGCPNDYKAEKEEKELQADVNSAIKVDVKKEIILRIAIIVISVITFLSTRNYIISENWINDLSNNLAAFLMEMCLIISIVEGFRNGGLKGAIKLPIYTFIGIAGILLIFKLVAKELFDNHTNLLGCGICATYFVPYFLRPLRLFIKYNVLKQDVDLKSLAENIE